MTHFTCPLDAHKKGPFPDGQARILQELKHNLKAINMIEVVFGDSACGSGKNELGISDAWIAQRIET
ncbi:MAG: hypothetical protein ACRDBM_06480 [Sporomusa sp.]